MSRRTLIFVLAAATIVAVSSHIIVLYALPGIFMNKASQILKRSNVAENEWVLAPRSTPEIQPIVRSSPDLSYSACLLDISDRPVHIAAPRWGQYGSISIFDWDTNNVFVGSLKGDGNLDLIVAREGQDVSEAAEADIVYIDTKKGVAIIRRLAPGQEQFDAAARLTEESVCALTN